MKRIGRWYCGISFVLAMTVVCLTLCIYIKNPEVAYAKEITTDEITDDLEDVSSFDKEKPNVKDANSNVINGLSIIYNNEEGSLSTSVSGSYYFIFSAFHFGDADVLYANYYCVTFCENCDWNTDCSAEPGFDWFGTIFDFFYYVANLSNCK